MPMCSSPFVQKLILIPFMLEEELEVVCHILQADILCASYKWHPPGVRVSLVKFLAAAAILQLLILHLLSKKSTPGVP